MSKVQLPVELNDALVVEFLRKYPDFFQRHPELLADMQLPHPDTGSAVSLLERQVGILRDQRTELRRRLQHLAQIGHANEALLEKMEQLILDLISATHLDEVLVVLERELKEEFKADGVTVRLFGRGQRPEFISADDPALICLERVLTRHEPVCGHLHDDQLQFLFGAAGEEVGSGALVPICEPNKPTCLGVLGIGSIDPRRFHPEMGTIFLRHLGGVLARVILRHMPS